jgi:AGZA family xanthine/uracil permease-like MFS transporter
MFDTVGCLIACAGKSNIIQPDGSVPNANMALFSDAVGTVVGSIFGSSTVTTYIESSVGVAEGGRSGLTAVTVGVLFLISLFLGPLFGSSPSAATASALILVGVMMVGPVKNIDFDDYTEAIPAFLTIIFMVCASSVSDGIMFGVMTYVLLKALSGRRKEIRGMTWIVFVIFTVKVVLDYFGLFIE